MIFDTHNPHNIMHGIEMDHCSDELALNTEHDSRVQKHIVLYYIYVYHIL